MLDKQTAFFPFARGVDSKTDPKQLVPGQLVTCQNAQFTTGQMMRKRNGTSAAIGAGAISALNTGKWIGSLNSDLLTADGDSLYSWSPGSAAWETRGKLQTALVTRSVGVRAGVTDTNLPVLGSVFSVTANGLEFTAYTFNASIHNVYWTVKDAATGGTIGANQFSTTGQATVFGVVALGTYFIILWYTSAQGVTATSILQSSPLTVSGNTVINAACTKPGPLVTNSNFPTYAFGAFATSTTNIIVFKITSGLVVTSANITTTAQAHGIGVVFDSGNGGCVVGYSYLNAAYQLAYAGFTSALGASWAPVVADNTTNAADASVTFTGNSYNNTGVLYWSVQSININPFSNMFLAYTGSYSFTSGTSALLRRDRGFALLSSPVTIGNYNYALAATSGFSSASTANQPGSMYFIVALFGSAVAPLIVARIAQEDGGIIWVLETGAGFNPVPGQMSLPSASVAKFPIWVRQPNLITNITTASNAAYDIATVDFANVTQGWQSANLGKSLFLNGGVLWEYDGQTLAEQGFHYPPVILGATPSNSGGFLSTGIYQYAVTYEWIDANGAVHRSAPAFTTVTTTGPGTSNSVQIWVPMLRNTMKSNVRICFYRTQVNQGTWTLSGSAANDPTVDILYTYTDTVSDANISANVPLYTQSAVYDMPCPPCGALAVFKNRLIAVSTEYTNQLWYSKQMVIGPGSVQPVEFSDLLYQSLDGLDGTVTALGVLDDKLMIGKPDTWYYMTGTGPAPDGSNNDFSTPLVVNQSSGCSCPSSVVTTSLGMFYQSTKGIFLISRGLAESYIGGELENLAIWTSNPITAAVLAPNTTQVRFTSGSVGSVFVYDYHYRQWSVWNSTTAAMTLADETVWNGVWVGLTTTGLVIQETPGTFLDLGTTAYALSVKTSWLQVAGPEGWQRVYRMQILGDFKSTSSMVVTLARDYSGSTFQTDTITGGTPFQFQVYPSIQKCQSLQVSITDSATTGESFDLSALGFYFAIKRGLFKLPPTASSG
ncbi:MAG TPA: hypothetical protein VMT56_00340 [Candidatus Bathyarchaeia archaeon]|nr:hypothetical protein [Candidatus Bathyarchaeia archaeon]